MLRMKGLTHVGLLVSDLEASAAFYERWLDARVSEAYRNEAKGFSSRFLDFESGSRLELMAIDSLRSINAGPPPYQVRIGIDHLAFVVGDEVRVNALYAEMLAAGVVGAGAPRRTGDGYYEGRVRDPDGVLIELCAEGKGQ